MILDPLDALTLRLVYLRRCRFLDTDLREAEITGAAWPTLGGRFGGRRFGVADEELEKRDAQQRVLNAAALATTANGAPAAEVSPPWERLERLYRELKQNCEDRRDNERAGDFHYGEKEMRRKNPKSRLSLRLFLFLYCITSGYGERYLRPLLWAGALLVISAFLYLWFGLAYPAGQKTSLSLVHTRDWFRALHYSFRVMTFLKSEQLATPLGHSWAVQTAESLLGPLFLGLFALAVRQHLKR